MLELDRLTYLQAKQHHLTNVMILAQISIQAAIANNDLKMAQEFMDSATNTTKESRETLKEIHKLLNP